MGVGGMVGDVIMGGCDGVTLEEFGGVRVGGCDGVMVGGCDGVMVGGCNSVPMESTAVSVALLGGGG